MTGLAQQHCVDYSQGTPALSAQEAAEFLAQLRSAWEIGGAGKYIHQTFHFPDFYHTIAFVNAVAYIANQQNHHPAMEIKYDSCRVAFDTHTVGGLSANDFICAAKVDRL